MLKTLGVAFLTAISYLSVLPASANEFQLPCLSKQKAVEACRSPLGACEVTKRRLKADLEHVVELQVNSYYRGSHLNARVDHEKLARLPASERAKYEVPTGSKPVCSPIAIAQSGGKPEIDTNHLGESCGGFTSLHLDLSNKVLRIDPRGANREVAYQHSARALAFIQAEKQILKSIEKSGSFEVPAGCTAIAEEIKKSASRVAQFKRENPVLVSSSCSAATEFAVRACDGAETAREGAAAACLLMGASENLYAAHFQLLECSLRRKAEDLFLGAFGSEKAHEAFAKVIDEKIKAPCKGEIESSGESDEGKLNRMMNACYQSKIVPVFVEYLKAKFPDVEDSGSGRHASSEPVSVFFFGITSLLRGLGRRRLNRRSAMLGFFAVMAVSLSACSDDVQHEVNFDRCLNLDAQAVTDDTTIERCCILPDRSARGATACVGGRTPSCVFDSEKTECGGGTNAGDGFDTTGGSHVVKAAVKYLNNVDENLDLAKDMLGTNSTKGVAPKLAASVGDTTLSDDQAAVNGMSGKDLMPKFGLQAFNTSGSGSADTSSAAKSRGQGGLSASRSGSGGGSSGESYGSVAKSSDTTLKGSSNSKSDSGSGEVARATAESEQQSEYTSSSGSRGSAGGSASGSASGFSSDLLAFDFGASSNGKSTGARKPASKPGADGSKGSNGDQVASADGRELSEEEYFNRTSSSDDLFKIVSKRMKSWSEGMHL